MTVYETRHVRFIEQVRFEKQPQALCFFQPLPSLIIRFSASSLKAHSVCSLIQKNLLSSAAYTILLYIH